MAERIEDRLGKVFRGTYLIPPFRRSAKGEENMQRRKLENLNLLDDFLFGTMVTYPGIGEAFVRELLKIIFQKEFGPLTVVPQKIYYGTDTDKHGARLDVYLEEASGDGPGRAPCTFIRKERRGTRRKPLSSCSITWSILVQRMQRMKCSKV